MRRVGMVAVGLAAVVGWVVCYSALAQAQPVASIALPSPGEAKQLYPGCNAVALTFPDGTTSQTVIQAVTPTGMVEALWRHNPGQNRFEAFSPAYPQASDLMTVEFLDAVWLCLTGASAGGTLPPPPAPPPPSVQIITPEPLPVTPPGTPMIELEVLSVDINRAPRGTPGIPVRYTVSYSAYDPADATDILCGLASPWPWGFITETDPPPVTSDFSCLVPGDAFRLEVILQVDPCSADQQCQSQFTAAAFDGVAPAQLDQWQSATLDSQDAFVPLTTTTDDPNLEFTANIRFRAIIVAPP